MLKYFSVCLIFLTLSYSQSYFPLQIGNRWDFDDFSSSVIGDTVMPNGKKYFVLSRALGPSKYLYADSNYIYYYDEYDSSNTPVYNLNAELNQRYNAGMNAWVTLSYIDTTEYFGITTRVLIYDYDTLVPFTLYLSEKFGPVYISSAEPPWEPPYTSQLIGCIISDTTYGVILSLGSNENNSMSGFDLFQNYPNPFNPKTNIEFSISQYSYVELFIYNLSGKQIKKLVSDYLNSGKYQITWNGTNENGSSVSSGVYLYKITAGNYQESKKLILIK